MPTCRQARHSTAQLSACRPSSLEGSARESLMGCTAAGGTHQVKVAQHLVVGGHFTLALQHFDAHLGLVVGGGGEHLRAGRSEARVMGGWASITV